MSVTLVRWAPRHAEPLQRILDDADVSRYLTTAIPNPYTIDDARAWIELCGAAEPALHFAIESEGTLAGGIGLTLESGLHAGSAMTGYYVAKPLWGRGIATEALRQITAYAFRLPGIERVWANVMGPNVASMRVLARAGFRHDATLPRALVDRFGNRLDEHVFSLLRD